MTFLNLATILCAGPMIGVEFAVSVFINPALRKLDDRTQFAVIRLLGARLGAAMPFWYCAALLLLILEAVLRRHQPGFPLLAAAAGIWVIAILLSVLFLVPINNRLVRTDSNLPPAAALREHPRWMTLHHLRVAVLIAALVCFLLAVPM